mmetsp:Transcript_11134/g.23923  ORF Transcript_11134/g.23923 Transcript_11134/m.23923 type:complete len:95 (-) Transcript_11134:316-600(-)
MDLEDTDVPLCHTGARDGIDSARARRRSWSSANSRGVAHERRLMSFMDWRDLEGLRENVDDDASAAEAESWKSWPNTYEARSVPEREDVSYRRI